MRTEPSTPFSSGTEYENFIYYFCERCKKGKRDEDDYSDCFYIDAEITSHLVIDKEDWK